MKLSKREKLVTLMLSFLLILPSFPALAAEAQTPEFIEGEIIYSPNL